MKARASSFPSAARMSWHALASGLSRVEPRAEFGVLPSRRSCTFPQGGEIDDIAGGEAAYAVACAENPQRWIIPAGAHDGAAQGLVDHGSGAAALGDNDR